MRYLAASLGAALLASTALAQQATEGTETPSADKIQSSTVIKDTIEVPGIEDREQSVEIDGAEPEVDVPRTAATGSGDADPEEAAEATAKVEELVEDGEVTDAEPTENWFGCDPEADDNPDHCEKTAETDADTPLPSADGVGDTEAVRDGGEATTVRAPTEGNDAVDNLTTGAPTAPPAANAPAAVTSATEPETTEPERPQELENEPQEVLPAGKIDMEADARVKPETATMADPVVKD